MAKIEILDSGIIDNRDSAFPTLVRLDNGDILAGFTVGGGPYVHGGTDLARSTDNGKTWQWKSTILSPGESPPTTNSLRLSRTPEEMIIAYGTRAYKPEEKTEWGSGIRKEPIFCTSRDQGRTWSEPQLIETTIQGPFEIASPMIVTKNGRWLAPGATLSDQQRLGEQLVVFISEDKGKTWSDSAVVMKDPEGIKGFFEQKLTRLDADRVMAVSWTLRMGDYSDFEDHFVISNDGGCTWGPLQSTGIRGQTMTPVWIGEDRLLVLYNRRYGKQGVIGCLVRFADDAWLVESEEILWDAKSSRETVSGVSGIDELDSFSFGLPSAIPLNVIYRDERDLLCVHWCKEQGTHVIRWTRIRVLFK